MHRWLLVDRRNAHQTGNRQFEFLLAHGDEACRVGRHHARLLRLLSGIDLDEQLQPLALFRHFGGDGMCDLRPVNGVNGIEQLHGFFGLVRLQWSDQVQLHVRKSSLERGPLRLRFLHPVLPKYALPGFERRQDLRLPERLRHGDQFDRPRQRTRLLACRRHSRAHLGQPATTVPI